MTATYQVIDTKFRRWTVSIAKHPVMLKHRGVKWNADCQTATLDGQAWLIAWYEDHLWNHLRQRPPFEHSLFVVARLDGKAVCGHVHIVEALGRVKLSLLHDIRRKVGL